MKIKRKMFIYEELYVHTEIPKSIKHPTTYLTAIK